VSPHPDDAYNEVTTAKADFSFDVLLCLLQPFQSRWATLHLNLSDYNDTDECNARPVEAARAFSKRPLQARVDLHRQLVDLQCHGR
jgi:hypothetical protein